MLHRVGWRVLHDSHDADDVVQLTFIQLFQHPESACPQVAGWLHRVAVNTAKNLRRSRVRRARREEAMVRAMIATRPTEEEESDLRDEIDTALDQLPDALREAVILHYLEGRSHEESARLSGCSEEAVRKRSQRGLRQLREVLAGRGMTCGVVTLAAYFASESAASAAAASVSFSAASLKLGHDAAATTQAVPTAATGTATTPAHTAGSGSIGLKLAAGSIAVALAMALGLAGYLGGLRGWPGATTGRRRPRPLDLVGHRRGSRFITLPLAEAATTSSGLPLFRPVNGGDDTLILPRWGEMTIVGIPFRVDDPRGGATRNAIVLYDTTGDYRRRRARVASVPCGRSATAIHLLGGVSAGGYPREPGKSVALIVRIRYAGGEVEDHSLYNGVHLADYSGPIDVPGSQPALKLKHGFQLRHVKIVPGRHESIDRVEFVKGNDRTAPVVMAVTAETGG